MVAKESIFNSRILPDPRPLEYQVAIPPIRSEGGGNGNGTDPGPASSNNAMNVSPCESSTTDGSVSPRSRSVSLLSSPPPSPPQQHQPTLHQARVIRQQHYKMSTFSEPYPRNPVSSSMPKRPEFSYSSSRDHRGGSNTMPSYGTDKLPHPHHSNTEPSFAYLKSEHSHSPTPSDYSRDFSPPPSRPPPHWTGHPAAYRAASGGGRSNTLVQSPILRIPNGNGNGHSHHNSQDADMDDLDDDKSHDGSSNGDNNPAHPHRQKRRLIEKKSRMRRVDALENLRNIVAQEKQPITDPLTQTARKNCQADICFDAVEIIQRLKHENHELQRYNQQLLVHSRQLEQKLDDDGHGKSNGRSYN